MAFTHYSRGAMSLEEFEAMLLDFGWHNDASSADRLIYTSPSDEDEDGELEAEQFGGRVALIVTGDCPLPNPEDWAEIGSPDADPDWEENSFA